MLESISVKNYAIIESLTIPFSSGFNTLTGETGAGKSIIIGALSLLCGGKSDTEVIRSGYDEATVAATVLVERESDAAAWLNENGIPYDSNGIILRRIVKTNGRNSIFIQDVPATMRQLQDFSAFLFDIHGQHEHQSLFQTRAQRELLDSYGGLTESVRKLNLQFGELAEKRKTVERMNKRESENKRDIELLEFTVDEINAAALTAGEDAELQTELNTLNQYESLFSMLKEFNVTMAENQGGALCTLRKNMVNVRNLSTLIKDIKDVLQRLENAFYEIEDIVENMAERMRAFTFNPVRLDEIEKRLMQIQRLKKKYGNSIEEILNFSIESSQKIVELRNFESNRAALEDEIKRLEKEIGMLAVQISGERKRTARELESKILEKLYRLGMPNAGFTIRLLPFENEQGKNSCGPFGLEKIEYYISPNKGEPLKPLKAIASGGEISRIMLAIKAAFAENDVIPTLVFDEVDAGIGGEVALAVGEELFNISGKKQILCITHLASIAVRADKHVKVEKSESNGRTLTTVYPVEKEDRVKEIARMLSGESKENYSLDHARELLKRYGTRAAQL